MKKKGKMDNRVLEKLGFKIPNKDDTINTSPNVTINSRSPYGSRGN